jgi:copper transport protein
VVIRRLTTILGAVLAALLLVPALADAHASLTGSTPASGAVLDRAPRQVEFTFSEHVEGSFGALRVIDDRGRRVDDGKVGRPGGRSDALTVGVRPGTGNGAYAATYRVISADGHPVSGGATIVVGRDVTAAPPDVRARTDAEAAPAGISTALSVARVVRYLGIGGVVGLLALVLLVWAPLRRRGGTPQDADAAFSRAAARWLRILAVVGAVGSLAALVLQGANVGGTGVGDALRPDTLRDVVGTRTGAWFLTTTIAFLLVAALAGRAVRTTSGIRGRAGPPRWPRSSWPCC